MGSVQVRWTGGARGGREGEGGRWRHEARGRGGSQSPESMKHGGAGALQPNERRRHQEAEEPPVWHEVVVRREEGRPLMKGPFSRR